MSFIGLDIGSYAVKAVEADGVLAKAKIKNAISIYNPVGQVLPNDKAQFEQLASAIKSGLRENGMSGKNVHVSLPGPHAYVSIISMPVLSDAELASAIKWEAEQHIPVSLDEVNFEYDVIHRPEKNNKDEEMGVFLVGAPKKTVDRYMELMELVGVEAIGMEPEIVSLVRAFNSGDGSGVNTLICNFGAIATSFVVVDAQKKIGVAHSSPLGSLPLTRVLEKGLGLAPAQAEEYKRTYGLDPGQLEGKVREVLQPVFDSVVREVRKTIQFYMSKNPGVNRIDRVIMVGGGSNLPEITTYLAEMISVEVVVGDPFAQFEKDKGRGQPGDVSSYAVGVGLAVKEF